MRSNWPQVDQSIHSASLNPYILADFISLLCESIATKDVDLHAQSNDWATLSAPCSQIRSFIQFVITIK